MKFNISVIPLKPEACGVPLLLKSLQWFSIPSWWESRPSSSGMPGLLTSLMSALTLSITKLKPHRSSVSLPAPGCQQASQAFAPAFSSAWNILPPYIHMKLSYLFPSFINCYLLDAVYTAHSTYAGYFPHNLPPSKIVLDLLSHYSFNCFLPLEDKLLE